jgi:hypothetical protein
VRASELPPDAAPRLFNVDIDMPIDPNEPTYCICNRVSFGEMVGCDNPDVRARLLALITPFPPRRCSR